MFSHSQKKLNLMLPRLVMGLLWALMLSACAIEFPVPKHPIMGSDFVLPDYKVTLQTEMERAAFQVKLFSLNYPDCVSGFLDYIEFDGSINKDAVDAFRNILPQAQGCKTRAGLLLYPFVYLNSSEGTSKDGMALGELLRIYNIETVVTQGQVCRGACALAFMGGKLRAIQDTGLVVFASSKTRGGGFGCERASEQVSMREYLQKMMMPAASDRLYFNLLNYCTRPTGWTLSAGSAPSWGVTNE